MKTPFGKTPGQQSRADAGHAGLSASIVKKRTFHEKQLHGVSPPVSQPQWNSVCCGIQHRRTEGMDGSKDEWRGMVLAHTPIMNTWLSII
uniref:Uncharacterized protein n=1 Tax=Bos indicus x Bos taurus TaxID=30522 RepID=A0A4W2CDY3_BOBOX